VSGRARRRDFLAVLGSLGAMTPFARTAGAEETAPTAINRLMNEGRYLPLWRETVGPPLKGVNTQWASFVGEETVALSGRNPPLEDELTKDAAARDAIAAIVAASHGRRVVMLNESHSASRHRLFLARVARALRPEGFDILAAETFTNAEASTVSGMKAGKPFTPSEGYYTCDPIFAEAAREALGLGYRLGAYEQRPDQFDRALKGAEAIARRETSQAANLAALLDANPGSRVLVHVGFSHLRKTPDWAGNLWLAARFKENTGIDPLSVSQAYSGSFAPHGQDQPLTQAVLARFSPKAPIVVDAGGKSLAAEMAGADMAVFHPALPDIDGRPGWLAADKVRKRIVVPVPKRAATETVIIQAVHSNDPERTVPADQHVLAKGETRAVLFLRPGSYRIRIESDAGFSTLKMLRV
jgi:hypothetical protein